MHENITADTLVARNTTPDIREKINPNDIILGHDAENTIGNAEETTRWLKDQHFRSIRLRHLQLPHAAQPTRIRKHPARRHHYPLTRPA